MTAVKAGDANTAVRRMIDHFITQVESVGLSYEGALQLMVIQAVVRMGDTRLARRLQDVLDAEGDD